LGLNVISVAKDFIWLSAFSANVQVYAGFDIPKPAPALLKF